MFLKSVIWLMLCSFLFAPLATADDNEVPTIAVLRFGQTAGQSLSAKGLFDILQAYGYFNEEERQLLANGEDVDGENMNVIWRSANSDIPTMTLMVREALDREVDAILPMTTVVTQFAVNATREMDNPPAILFSLVGSPYFAGIADAPCIKPNHVTGSRTTFPYGQGLSAMHLWNPDVTKIGMIVVPDIPVSVSGGRQILQLGEELGLNVETATATSLGDLNLAVEALLDKGVEAILNPVSTIVILGTPLMTAMAAEYGIPVFGPAPYHVYNGATVGVGFNSLYGEGVIQGRMLIAHLNGDIDISEISINRTEAFGIAVNLDSAREQGVVIPDELLAKADYVIENGVSSAGVSRELPEVVTSLPEMPVEERRAADLAFLETLRCTPEVIADQRAELEDTWAEE